MCGAQRGLGFNFDGNGPERRQLYKSRSGWQKKIVFPFVVAARKTILPYGKDPNKQNRRMKLFTRFALKRCALDAPTVNRNDRHPMRILCTLLFLGICSGLRGAEPAATVFINGNIYTMNERQPHSEAIAIKGDRIVFVGSNADTKKYQTPGVGTVDLRGKTVVPGLTDSHCHIFGIGERELTLNLEGTNTLGDFLARVKERVTRAEPGKWITGRGWIETFWKPPQFPTRADLDKIAPNNPVV